MKNLLYFFHIVAFLLLFSDLSAQVLPANPEEGKNTMGDRLDSLRKIDEERQDTVIYTAKYIRYTRIDLLKDSTRTLPLDTGVYNFQHYSPVAQPTRPTVNLGNTGLAARDLLFNPSKSIGFDAGFHALDFYLLTEDSIRYYRARSPFTDLYFVNGSGTQLLFKATHSQNIKPNWNFGANYFRNGSEGYYKNQQVNHLNAAIFTWYESKNKRYNLLANALFNTLKAAENGSVIKDSLFTEEGTLSLADEPVRLSATGTNRPMQTWRQKTIFLKQFYYIGRIDSLNADTSGTSILPTQRFSHALTYSYNSYKFFKNEPDLHHVFPYQEIADMGDYTVGFNTPSAYYTSDSTVVKDLRNEFMYSFYLRGKSVKFIKNELKLDLGLQHDLYRYEQMGHLSTFQNLTLKARPGYRFSDRVNIEGDLQQIFQGRNAGDYLYEANTNFLLSNSAGRIILGAYAQNKSPEQIYERVNYQYYKWNENFDRTKINNLSFTYENPKIQTQLRADYYLVSKYLYFQESSVFPNQIAPEQSGNNINLLKLTLQKRFKFGKFNLVDYLVYQKTDYQDLLRTPDFYTYNSFYYGNLFFKVLYTDIGFDVWYNSAYPATSYALDIGQFYNGREVTFANYPVVDVWIRANLKRANLFLKYNYANQGLFSKGYYTVNRYPMQNALLTFGVSWNFYD